VRDVDISGSVQKERKARGRRTVGRHTGGDGCISWRAQSRRKKRKAGEKGKHEQNASLKDTLMVHKNKVVDNTDGTGAVSEIGSRTPLTRREMARIDRFPLRRWKESTPHRLMGNTSHHAGGLYSFLAVAPLRWSAR